MTEVGTELPTHETNESEKNTTEIADFLFKSFATGQGDPTVQSLFMDYAHIVHPEWKIDDSNREKIRDQITKRVMSYLRYADPSPSQPQPPRILHHNVDKNDKIGEIDDQVKNLEKALNNPQVKDKEKLIGEITLETIRKDFHFLYDEKTGEPKARKRSNPETIIDTNDPKYRAINDPYLSYLCYYGLTEQKGEGPKHTFHDETLDKAFADVGKYFFSGKMKELDREDDAKFDRVIESYNQHHPENPVTW